MTKKKIVIIDDYIEIAYSISILLESYDYECEVLLNPEELLSYNQKLPNLILLDIWMPQINGYRVYKLLKKSELMKNIPVVLMTADKVTRYKYENFGKYDLIYKPFLIQDLLNCVNHHLS